METSSGSSDTERDGNLAEAGLRRTFAARSCHGKFKPFAGCHEVHRKRCIAPSCGGTALLIPPPSAILQAAECPHMPRCGRNVFGLIDRLLQNHSTDFANIIEPWLFGSDLSGPYLVLLPAAVAVVCCSFSCCCWWCRCRFGCRCLCLCPCRCSCCCCCCCCLQAFAGSIEFYVD